MSSFLIILLVGLLHWEISQWRLPMEPQTKCHVAAVPYPGRGHINPMINLCKLITARRPDTLFTVILTEEWYGFVRSDPPVPENIRFATIPNVIPSEIGRANDFTGFYRATQTELEAPVEELLDGPQLQPKPNVILHDTYLPWVVSLGNRKNIPVASVFPMSATVFSVFHHWHLLVQNGHTDNPNISERVNYLPGIPSIQVSDLPTPVNGKGKELIDDILKNFSMVPKAQFLLFTSVYELEAPVIDALKETFRIPIHPIGPAIPYFSTKQEKISPVIADEESDHMIKWLNTQPESSVLYISQGSFLSVSNAQLDEIVAGVHESGVRFFWVTRGDASRFQRSNGNEGIVVPWCDQFKVLCHPAIGGFWLHCGWNSTKEAVFAGLPMLTFPIFWDQTTNSKLIVEDLKIGIRLHKGDGSLVKRDEICELLKRFMDLENVEMKEMRRRAKLLKEICQNSMEKGGSSDVNIDDFINKIL